MVSRATADSSAPDSTIGAVIIGRNEGERLRRCLASITGRVTAAVYVDSGSTDSSIALAKSMGANVIELDTSIPFTAARARNAGARALLERFPNVAFIQFVDGDCELDDAWIAKAYATIAEDGTIAVVCGRRRERFPERTVWNRLCDIEWDTPVGDAQACGGDALIRVSAYEEVGGYRDDLIAGEEPEMCLRIRHAGWRIVRIDAEMTLHDAAMTTFEQWWKRTKRGGYAWAEGYALHGRAHDYRKREVVSTLLWAVGLPASSLALVPATGGLSLLGLGLYGVLGARIRSRALRRGLSSRDASVYAVSCVAGKFPQAAGMMSYAWNRLRQRRGELIEYKGSETPHLLYIGALLPMRTETFVYRELFALRERGWNIFPVSVNHPDRNLGDERLDRLADESTKIYVDGSVALLRRALGEAVRHPWRTASTLGFALRCAVGPDVSGVKRLKILWQTVGAISVAQAARRQQVNYIHSQMAHVPTTVALMLSRQLGVPFSFTGHAVDIFRERALLATKLRHAQFCSCISHWHREFYRSLVPLPDERLPIVRCGVSINHFVPREPVARDHVHIVAVGRLIEKKGFDLLLRALAKLSDPTAAGFRFRCTIVGEGDDAASLAALSADLGLVDRVTFTGVVPHHEVRSYMQAADLFVLPCRVAASGDRDGIPVVLMEAMACQIPVIAGDIPSIRELVIDHETGLLAEPESVDALARAIGEFGRSSELRERLAALGRKRVLDEFTLELNVDRIEAALRRFQAGGPVR